MDASMRHEESLTAEASKRVRVPPDPDTSHSAV